MAVRLLAGPFDTTVTDDQPADLVIQAVPRMWIPGSGVMMSTVTGQGGWYVANLGMMTLDGRVCDRGNEPMGYEGWWPAKQRVVQSNWYAGDGKRELMYDQITFAQEYTGPETIPGFVTASYIRLADRRLRYSSSPDGAHSFRALLNDGVTEVQEGPPPPWSGITTSGRVHPGRSETEVFVEASAYRNNVQAAFYDTVKQVWSSPVYYLGVSCYSLVYSTDFGVIVTGHNSVSDPELDGKSNQIRIWSLEVEPTIVTPVERMSGTVKSGQVVTYRVRVTGAHNDPASEELIDWTITGPGTLLDPQTLTDANGYATTRVQYRLGDTGNSVVTATLSC
jgi:hypothetical protein